LNNKFEEFDMKVFTENAHEDWISALAFNITDITETGGKLTILTGSHDYLVKSW